MSFNEMICTKIKAMKVELMKSYSVPSCIIMFVPKSNRFIHVSIQLVLNFNRSLYLQILMS